MIVVQGSYIPSEHEKANMRAMEENIEKQLRPPCLLLKLVEEPHIDVDVACSTNVCEPRY
jgi:hypothetical protein